MHSSRVTHLQESTGEHTHRWDAGGRRHQRYRLQSPSRGFPRHPAFPPHSHTQLAPPPPWPAKGRGMRGVLLFSVCRAFLIFLEPLDPAALPRDPEELQTNRGLSGVSFRAAWRGGWPAIVMLGSLNGQGPSLLDCFSNEAARRSAPCVGPDESCSFLLIYRRVSPRSQCALLYSLTIHVLVLLCTHLGHAFRHSSSCQRSVTCLPQLNQSWPLLDYESTKLLPTYLPPLSQTLPFLSL